MKINDINLKIILDSRGKETLSAELSGIDAEKRGIISEASVPAGKSTGAHEAFVLEPKLALGKFQEIKPQILNHEFENQEEFDNFLIKLDGTLNKSNLGGNLILSLSLTFARLKAKSEGKELFQYIRDNFQFPRPTSPRDEVFGGRAIFNFQSPKPIFNVINGGIHAQNKLEFQEFQVIPMVEDFGIALSIGKEFYRKLQEFLENKFGKENIFLGDEAGFSAPFKNNEEAIEILADLIEKYKYPLRIGLDVAATQFYLPADLSVKVLTSAEASTKTGYLIDGKKYSAEELKDYYLKLINAYNIISIEDPFYEEDFNEFAKLTQNLTQNKRETLVITDDLTTTNPERLKTAIEKKSGNAILIKLNQIGTLTETLSVVKMAYENDWQVVVSHRSGETMDDFIADLSVAINAWGIKAGAPAKPERLAKYNRILEIKNKLTS